MGDVDDVLDAKLHTLDQLVRRSDAQERRLIEKDVRIASLEADIKILKLKLSKECENNKKILDRLSQLKKELGQTNQDRMKESQLVVSLLATQAEQQKKLDELQNQVTDALQVRAEQKEEIAEEIAEDVAEVQVLEDSLAAGTEEPVAVDAKGAPEHDLQQVFNPSQEVNPVQDEIQEEDKNNAQVSELNES